MILVGELSLWVALLMSAWSAIVSFAGANQRRDALTQSAARGLHATSAFLLLAVVGVWTALLSHDFSINLVASHSSENLPRIYLVAALWAGDAGALLLFTTSLSVCASIALVTHQRSLHTKTPWLVGVLATFTLCALVVLCFGLNPYARSEWSLGEGRGLAPQLQHLGTALYHVLLQVAFAALAVASALSIAETMQRRHFAMSAVAVRRWTVIASVYLAISIVLRVWSSFYAPYVEIPNQTDPLTFPGVFVLLTMLAALVISLVVSSISTGRNGERVTTALRLARYVAFAGALLIAVAFTAQRFHQGRVATVKTGDAIQVIDTFGHAWSFKSFGVSRYEERNRRVLALSIDASRDGKKMALLLSEKRQYIDSRGEPVYAEVTTTDARSMLTQDVTLRFAKALDADTATLRIDFYPLLSLLWVGAALVILGGVVALWPGPRLSATSQIAQDLA